MPTKQTESFSLSERAILVDLTIGNWRARRKDDKVSAEVYKRHKTDDKAGKFNKNLLPFDAPTYDTILSIVNEARTFHRMNTLPWSDTGLRILPNANSETYNEGMRVREFKFREAVDKFVPDLFRAGGLKEQAKVKLNGMFRDEDYPDDEVELSSYFSFEVKPWPLPEVGDLRVKLTAPQVEAIKQRVASSIASASTGALREAWNRLLYIVHHAGEIFEDPSARLTKVLFENMRAECDLLDRLNVTGDKNFAATAKQVRREIVALGETLEDRKVLRKDKDARKVAADKVAEIERRMAGYMRGVQS